MTRKGPNIPVAILNDDGTSRIVGADELRAQREEREARITPVRPIVKGQKLTTIEILQHLAVAKRAHEAFYSDDPDARIPADLIDQIAIAVAGKRTWSKIYNDERTSEAGRRARHWQPKANKVWAKNPQLSARRVAELIAEPGENADTIRRHIRKP